MTSNRIVELARIISENTNDVNQHLVDHNLPTPSFSSATAPSLLYTQGPEFNARRQRVIDATDELQALMLGPVALLSSLTHNHLLSIQAILRFDLTSFPDDADETTFAELATSKGLDEDDVSRILRHAMAFHIFHEPQKGRVVHNAASKQMCDPRMRAWLAFATEELWPSAVKTTEALEHWKTTNEPHQTAFNIAFDTPNPFFREIAGDAKRQTRYDTAMAWFNTGPGLDPASLILGYPWADCKSVVDVGGNTGLVSIAIAQSYPEIHFTVQDQASVVSVGRSTLPPVLESRIKFMEHDFFQSQPVVADVYFFRWIFHDWSDRYAVRILQALIPSLKPGAKVVVNEFVLPEPGKASGYHSKLLRAMDLSMMELHNGRERDADDWKSLFRKADSRFENVTISQPAGSRLAIIEATWDSYGGHSIDRKEAAQ